MEEAAILFPTLTKEGPLITWIGLVVCAYVLVRMLALIFPDSDYVRVVAALVGLLAVVAAIALLTSSAEIERTMDAASDPYPETMYGDTSAVIP